MNKQQKIERAYEEMGGELKLLYDNGIYVFRSNCSNTLYTNNEYIGARDSLWGYNWEYICTKQEFNEYANSVTNSATREGNVNLSLERTVGAATEKLTAENLTLETALEMLREWQRGCDPIVEYVHKEQ